jgi:para-nitrobenzyl esterase
MVADLVNKAGASAFLYHFEYVPEWRKPEWRIGAVHSAEIMFAFDSLDTSSWGGDKVNATDLAVAKRVNSCWIAFIKAPANAKTLTCAGGFTWPAYTAETDQVAAIGETFSVKKGADIPDGPPRAPPPTGAPPRPAGN